MKDDDWMAVATLFVGVGVVVTPDVLHGLLKAEATTALLLLCGWVGLLVQN